jgi:L-serine deaminase
MAFSISFSEVGSQGEIRISCGSGADTCAIWLIGVGVP